VGQERDEEILGCAADAVESNRRSCGGDTERMNDGKKRYLCSECWTTYEHTVDEEGHLACPTCGNGTFLSVEELVEAYENLGLIRNLVPRLTDEARKINTEFRNHLETYEATTLLGPQGDGLRKLTIEHFATTYMAWKQRLWAAFKKDRSGFGRTLDRLR